MIVEQAGQHYLFDQFRIAWPPLPLSIFEATVLQCLDGQRSLADVRSFLHSELPDHKDRFNESLFEHLQSKLHDSLFLEGATFQKYLNGPVRRSSVFPNTSAEQLRAEIAKLFAESGLPGPPRPDGSLRAVLVPHMDYGRGGRVYGHGFKALAEGTDATLFVIIATSHYSPRRFTLTRMDFETPLGRVPTDQAYIDRIVHHHGDGLFEDPLAHLPEHSIELEVAVLQYLWHDRPFRIVPLLVGSFQDCIEDGSQPRTKPDIARMIEALKQAERQAGEKVCYVISGDLAHIGQRFDDPALLNESWLAASAAQDREVVTALSRANADAYFDGIASEKDRRRICGLPPTYVALDVLKPPRGEVLAYNQFVNPMLTESVSYAAASFI
jgi:hypothetical protein